MGDKRYLRLAGVGLVLVVLGAFGLTRALYTHAFSNPAEVTLRTDRAGLVMDAGNKVKLRGVEIGRVASVDLAGGRAVIVLDIDRDQLTSIPADVTAQIRSSTVFGAKYVELVPPRHPSSQTLADGAEVRTTGVTTEVNTVFQSLDRVLTGVDVSSLNGTLTVLAEALGGRGDQIADVAARADAYLTRLQPLLPQLREDLLQVAETARLGVRVSPALVRILRNATTTAATVSDNDAALHALLVDLSVLGSRGAQVLGVNGTALSGLLQSLRPTAATLRAYSSELPCLLQGLDNTRKIMAKVIGGTTDALRAFVSVRSQLPKYTYPANLPHVPHGRGPSCYAMPLLSGANTPFPERGTVQ